MASHLAGCSEEANRNEFGLSGLPVGLSAT